MTTVRTTYHLYDIDVYPIEALPGSGHTWAAKVQGVRKAIDGTSLRFAVGHEHYGATAGAALDAALADAMAAIVDDNPA